eukprot:7724896-Alexandrium_andersonii.AAC.1
MEAGIEGVRSRDIAGSKPQSSNPQSAKSVAIGAREAGYNNCCTEGAGRDGICMDPRGQTACSA